MELSDVFCITRYEKKKGLLRSKWEVSSVVGITPSGGYYLSASDALRELSVTLDSSQVIQAEWEEGNERITSLVNPDSIKLAHYDRKTGHAHFRADDDGLAILAMLEDDFLKQMESLGFTFERREIDNEFHQSLVLEGLDRA